MLHYAVAYGQINAIKLLLEHGAGTYIVVAKLTCNNYFKKLPRIYFLCN